MRIQLRPYQKQSVELLNQEIDRGKKPLCVLPTGAGKSLVMAELLKRRDQNALVLSHVSELLKQDGAALASIAPEIEQSFFAAKLQEKKLGTQVVFGSVQSVVRSLRSFKKFRQLLFVDEAHLCPRSSDAMYAQVFDYFKLSARVGFTATPMRLDSGSLIAGPGAWFDCIAHEVPFGELVEQGYLVPLVGVISEQQANLDNVAERGGEFVQEEAQEAVLRTLDLDKAIDQAINLAARRKSWLVFAAGIEHADKITATLRAKGVAAASVTNKTPTEERTRRLEQFITGELKALVNVGVLTTGFDAPVTDCLISMRPTQSPVLWQQMLGRGVRLAVGKKNCLVLDFVGNLDRLGGANMVHDTTDYRLPGSAKKGPAKPGKKKSRSPPVFFDASHKDPMVTGEAFEARVKVVTYISIPSRKQPGKKLLLASYVLEDQFGRVLRANSFIPVEYDGAAKSFAARWFALRGIVEPPLTADDAALRMRYALQPREVLARFDARFRSVIVQSERF